MEQTKSKMQARKNVEMDMWLRESGLPGREVLRDRTVSADKETKYASEFK